MKKLLTATVALLVSATVYTVSAQQGPPLGQTGNAVSGNHMGPPHGPPPNVTQAIALLEQAKQQGTAASNALIDQAETLLKQPPPPHNGPPGGQGVGQSNGGQPQGGQGSQSSTPQNATQNGVRTQEFRTQKGAPLAQ